MAKKLRKGGPWECQKCGALNASTMETCGACQTPFARTDEDGALVTGSSATSVDANGESGPIERTLSGLLARTEGNWVEYYLSVHGKLGRMVRESFTIGFISENEEVTLNINKSGHATLGDDYFSTHVFDFQGPEEEILKLLACGKNIPGIPDSVFVSMGGREIPRGAGGFGIISPMLRESSRGMVQQLAADMLRTLLKD